MVSFNLPLSGLYAGIHEYFKTAERRRIVAQSFDPGVHAIMQGKVHKDIECNYRESDFGSVS
jgi:hypothetical protein